MVPRLAPIPDPAPAATSARPRPRSLEQVLPTSQNLSRASKEAVRRLLLLYLAGVWKFNGKPLAAFRKEQRISTTTFWRWEKRFERDGLAGLVPNTNRCGRKPTHPALARIRRSGAARWAAKASRSLETSSRLQLRAAKQIKVFSRFIPNTNHKSGG